MSKALTGPVFQILDSLRCSGGVELTEEEVSPDHAEDLHVDDVGRGLVAIPGKTASNAVRLRLADEHVIEAGGINDQH